MQAEPKTLDHPEACPACVGQGIDPKTVNCEEREATGRRGAGDK